MMFFKKKKYQSNFCLVIGKKQVNIILKKNSDKMSIKMLGRLDVRCVKALNKSSKLGTFREA